MTSPFSKPSEFTGGSYFKPAEHMNDLALIVEPKRIDKNVENNYQGAISYRDEVTADVTVFTTTDSLEKGEPSQVMKDVKIVHGMLTSNLERNMGGVTLAVIRKVPTKRGSGYGFRDVEDSNVEAQAAAYFTSREEKVEAALAEVPSFD